MSLRKTEHELTNVILNVLKRADLIWFFFLCVFTNQIVNHSLYLRNMIFVDINTILGLVQNDYKKQTYCSHNENIQIRTRYI